MTDAQQPGHGATGQTEGTAFVPPADPNTTLPTIGRQAFSRISLTITEDEMSQTGTQKVVLDNWNQSQIECERLRDYEVRYHKADKECAVLREKARGRRIADICLGSGGVIVGVSVAIWDKTYLAVIIGLLGAFLMSVPLWALRGDQE